MDLFSQAVLTYNARLVLRVCLGTGGNDAQRKMDNGDQTSTNSLSRDMTDVNRSSIKDKW